MDDAAIENILTQNKSKNFVQRILTPEKYPSIDMGKGYKATHLMSWGSFNGKNIVFPTIIYDGKNLQQYKPDDAFKHAIKTGEFIEFDYPEDADAFSKEYKKFWQKGK